jgi:hypothetical protein
MYLYISITYNLQQEAEVMSVRGLLEVIKVPDFESAWSDKVQIDNAKIIASLKQISVAQWIHGKQEFAPVSIFFVSLRL